MELLWQRLDGWLRISIPSLSAFIMTFLGASAWPVPYLGPVMPPLAFMALFYWSAHRPDLFPPLIAFFIGLLNDFINGNILGVSALLFTVGNRIIWKQRGFFAGHSFFLLWAGFSLTVTIYLTAQWFLISLLNWQAISIFPAAIQLVLAIILFPLPCWILILLQRGTTSSD